MIPEEGRFFSELRDFLTRWEAEVSIFRSITSRSIYPQISSPYCRYYEPPVRFISVSPDSLEHLGKRCAVRAPGIVKEGLISGQQIILEGQFWLEFSRLLKLYGAVFAVSSLLEEPDSPFLYWRSSLMLSSAFWSFEGDRINPKVCDKLLGDVMKLTDRWHAEDILAAQEMEV